MTKHIGGQGPAGTERRGLAIRTTIMQRWSRRFASLVRATGGNAVLEFALVAPILLVLMMGTAQFGITWNNYVVLTNAVDTGTRLLALSRGTSTPRTSAVNQIYSAAPNLAQSSLTIEIAVNATDCNSDATCAAALSSGVGNPVTVVATYPCDLKVMGVDYAPGCTLSSTTTGRVE